MHNLVVDNTDCSTDTGSRVACNKTLFPALVGRENRAAVFRSTEISVEKNNT
jgi:hypothetical protein